MTSLKQDYDALILGAGAAKVDWVEITWPKPGGKTQRVVNPPMDRYLTVKEE